MSVYKDMTLKELMRIGDEDFKRLDSKDRLAIIARLNSLHANKSGTRRECAEFRAPIEKRMRQLVALHEQAWTDLWRNY
jgi:hypothetical protein